MEPNTGQSSKKTCSCLQETWEIALKTRALITQSKPTTQYDCESVAGLLALLLTNGIHPSSLTDPEQFCREVQEKISGSR